MTTKQLRLVLAAAVTLGLAGDARATLGGDAASIVADQQQLGATHAMTSQAAGERHELHLSSGHVVYEYLSPGGAVWAVSWRGRGMPDLRTLLGAHFARLSTGRRRGGHHRMTLTDGDLVLESTGHGRVFFGRAWVPSLVPAGVDAQSAVEIGQ